MLDYISFREAVIECSEYESFTDQEVLRSVPEDFRRRYIYILKKGFDIGTAHRVLLYCQKMNKDEFEIYLEQVMISAIGF